LLKDQIALLRDLVILAAILLFASGWLVSYFYFQSFGISLNGLGWPAQSYYLYSFIPVRYAAQLAWPLRWPVSWPVFTALGTLVVILFLCWRVANLRPLWLGAGLLLGMVWLYPVAFYAAQDEAKCARRGGGNLSTYLLINWDSIAEKPDARASAEMNALKEAIARNSAVIVAQSDTSLYVLYEPDVVQARASGEYGRAPIFRIPADAVRLTRSSATQLPVERSVPWGGSCNG
jgi:hypothetical protein